LIRENHPHERDSRNVVALGDHLRTDQDVDGSASQSVEDHFDTLARCSVPIEASNARFGEALFDRMLQLLGPNTEVVVFLRAACHARSRNRTVKIAIVAP
jgi:hypothetical protein